MIHPHTELRFINQTIGYGVFATAFMPQGTIVYVQDALEIVLDANDPLMKDRLYRPILDKYCTIEADGKRILSWDIARYVNHSCRGNTLSSGYGFEVAVRDIRPGEEITDDYAMFNLPFEMDCACGHPECRGVVSPDDFASLRQRWDTQVHQALARLTAVPQPLWPYLAAETQTAVTNDQQNHQFRSVAVLQRAGSHKP